LRLLAHALYGRHDLILLSQKRIAQISRPLNVIRQPFDDVWQCG
jgi:hypothetical protein